jgi:hypothetical protein
LNTFLFEEKDEISGISIRLLREALTVPRRKLEKKMKIIK